MPGEILDPKATWADPQSLRPHGRRDVAGRFEANFARFVPHVDDARSDQPNPRDRIGVHQRHADRSAVTSGRALNATCANEM